MFGKVIKFLGYVTFAVLMALLMIALAPFIPIIAGLGTLIAIGVIIGRVTKKTTIEGR